MSPRSRPTESSSTALDLEEMGAGRPVPEVSAVAVLDALTAQVAVLDAAGTIVQVNQAWRRFGEANGCRDPAHFVGASYLEACAAAARRDRDEIAEAMWRGLEALLRGELPELTLEYPCHAPGEKRWFVVRCTLFPLQGESFVVVAHENVTERKLAEDALRAAESTLRMVLDTLPVGVWIMDETGTIVHGNPAGLRIWGGARYVGPDRFQEYKGWWVSSGEPIAGDEWAAARAIRKGEASFEEEVRIECFDGSSKLILNSALPLRDSEGRITGAIIVNQDVTARKQAEARLLETKRALEAANRELQEVLEREQVMARTDQLTGLANRRHFLELAGHLFSAAVRYRQPLSIVLMDLDRFKRVNDTFGHQVGDEVLRRVAEVAAESLRHADVLARFGGEELIALLPSSAAQQARVAAEHIREAVARHVLSAGNHEVRVTLSAGVAEILPEGDSLDQLIQRADRALYAAKAAGRNRTVIAPSPA